MGAPWVTVNCLGRSYCRAQALCWLRGVTARLRTQGVWKVPRGGQSWKHHLHHLQPCLLSSFPPLSLAAPRIHWSEENQIKPGNTRTSSGEGLAHMQQAAILAPGWIYPGAHAGLPSSLGAERKQIKFSSTKTEKQRSCLPRRHQ